VPSAVVATAHHLRLLGRALQAPVRQRHALHSWGRAARGAAVEPPSRLVPKYGRLHSAARPDGSRLFCGLTLHTLTL
jgi:hypothetical protein